MWEKHPTLKALIKMTTSGRYRFPTADCNDEERELMKQVETELRDEVSFVTTSCLGTESDTIHALLINS